MRTIDADVLINELVNECNNDSQKELPVWIEKKIDAQPTIGGWISIKDRLPKPFETVVLYDAVNVRFYVGGIQQSGPFANWYAPPYQPHMIRPTHWLPLLDPPEEEKDK